MLDLALEYPALLALTTHECPGFLDPHDIVMELLLASNGTQISKLQVRHAIVDEIRRVKSKDRLHQRAQNLAKTETNWMLFAESLADSILTQTELSPLQKEIIYHKFFRDQSIRDIANTLQKTVPEITQQLWFALEKLRSTGRKLGATL